MRMNENERERERERVMLIKVMRTDHTILTKFSCFLL